MCSSLRHVQQFGTTDTAQRFDREVKQGLRQCGVHITTVKDAGRRLIAR